MALRDRLSMPSRRRLALARVQARRPLAPLRVWPDFLVIGAQRCGTSSLFRYLGDHPDVVPPVRKETEYFSGYMARGPGWYRAHFPTRVRGGAHELASGRPMATFEATPDYLFDPRTPARVAEALPDVPLIVLLRDPVERAFSHYKHMRRLGFEDLAFEDAVAAEDARIGPDLARAMEDPAHRPVHALRHSYVARGRYVEQLQRWFHHVPRERLLLLASSDLFEDPRAVVRRVCAFVGLRDWAPDVTANHSYASDEDRARSQAASMSEDVRRHLDATFRAANATLPDLLAAQDMEPTVMPSTPSHVGSASTTTARRGQ